MSGESTARALATAKPWWATVRELPGDREQGIAAIVPKAIDRKATVSDAWFLLLRLAPCLGLVSRM
jgi:hypothetical protein